MAGAGYALERHCYCGRLATFSDGLCRTHHDAEWRKRNYRPTCCEPDDKRPWTKCLGKVMARGRCNKHYRRLLEAIRAAS